jgi:hypothetical protein
LKLAPYHTPEASLAAIFAEVIIPSVISELVKGTDVGLFPMKGIIIFL